VLGELPDAVPFGIRIVVHATPQGPRSAPVISEAFVDGAIAAFHGPPPNPGLVADALASRLRGTSPRELERLLSLRWAGNLIPRSPFDVTPTYVQVSPCDERCLAGEVTIARDSRSRAVEISGELLRGMWIAYSVGDGIYGMAPAAAALLSMADIVVAVNSYDPFTDNADGIAGMAELAHEVHTITDALDAVSHTGDPCVWPLVDALVVAMRREEKDRPRRWWLCRRAAPLAWRQGCCWLAFRRRVRRTTTGPTSRC
jgi:hypothetical protein